MSGNQEIQHVAADASKFQRSNHSSLDSLTQKVRNELNACGDVFSFSRFSARHVLSSLRALPYTTLAINSLSLSIALTPRYEHTMNIGHSRQKIWATGRGKRGSPLVDQQMITGS